MSRFWHWEWCVRWATIVQFSWAWFVVIAFQVPYNLWAVGINVVLGLVIGTLNHRYQWSRTE